MAVPNTFAAATSAIPLANLDANFAYYDAAYSITSTAISFTGAVTLSTGTVNGVPYLNASKVLTSGAVLTFDGTILSSTRFAGALNGTVGATTANTGAFTTLTTSSTVTISGGTANGVAYLDGSKVLTTGSALTFDSADRLIVGAGSAAVGHRMEVVPTGAGGAIAIRGLASTAVGYISWHANTAATEYARITSDNTSSLFFGLGSAGADQMILTSSGLEVKQSQLIGYSSYAGIGTNGLAVAGNVGIGTSSPAYKLDVAATSGACVIRSYASASADSYLETKSSTGSAIYGIDATGAYVYTATAIPVRFFTNNNERMRIDSSGSLVVGGTSAIAGTVLTLQETASLGAALALKNRNSTQTWKLSVDAAAVDDKILAFIDNGTSTVRMALTDTGNLGLGVTPNTGWANGYKAIQNLGTSWFATTSRDANFGTNVYVAAGGYKYIDASAASLYTQFLGAHSWYSSTSAQVAGTDPVFSQAMTLFASGSLALGTTSDPGGGHFAIGPDSAKTATSLMWLANTGGRLYIGKESSAGGTIINGTAAYAGVIATNNAYPLQFGTDNATRMTLDASGNLLVGQTALLLGPVDTKSLEINGSAGSALVLNSAGALGSYIFQSGSNLKITNYQNGFVSFGTNNAERMRLDSSGNLLVGTTSALATNARVAVKYIGGGTAYGIVLQPGTDTTTSLQFLNAAGGSCGSISQTDTVTTYNVTSDQRLKENIADAEPASALIDNFQVRQYNWKSNGSHQRYGFIAQELVVVAPEAVHQPADPEEMMAVDYSKLVPMLVKEIQDLRKRLAAAGI